MYNNSIKYNMILNKRLKTNAFFVSVMGDLLFSIYIDISIYIAQNHTGRNTQHTNNIFFANSGPRERAFFLFYQKNKKK